MDEWTQAQVSVDVEHEQLIYNIIRCDIQMCKGKGAPGKTTLSFSHTRYTPLRHTPLGKHSRSHSRDENTDGSRKIYIEEKTVHRPEHGVLPWQRRARERERREEQQQHREPSHFTLEYKAPWCNWCYINEFKLNLNDTLFLLNVYFI